MNNGHLFILLAILTTWGSNPHFSRTAEIENDKTESAVSSSGILKNVVKHAPKVSSKEIEDSEIRIAKMAHEEENKKLQKMGKCAKDYTLPCPKFWKKKIMNKSENICIASSTYNGFCNPSQSFDNFTQNEKIKFETSCNVEWGCKNVVTDACESGKRNYNEPCPEGFISQNDNTCAADLTVYDGLCNGEKIDFTHLTSEEKQNWSVACEAYWPCYVNCEALSVCPSKWKQINSYECAPPRSYNGPCKDTKNFKFFNERMKIKFEDKCKVTFACTELCEKNYLQECPLHWGEKNGYCLAPPSFNLCERKKFPYRNLTQDEKKQFEEECSVQWPCRESPFCEMDWAAECPLNWVKETPREGANRQGGNQQGDEYICTADSSLYSGKCAFISLPNGADEEAKRELASTCDTPWPCSSAGAASDAASNAAAEGGPLPPSDRKRGERRGRATTNGPVTLKGGVRASAGPAYRVVDDQGDLPLADIMR
ncbi:hypothetical protein, conserved [Plasmodium vivax]|uniref:CPW-WPC domain-containing protein n=1 Tax=Plasmodium vivax (strain Salvador I) TaxID=126793 RepID=A5K7W1_PLAVS|nr:hypothetical protein, conserved [Plasmodium vivax]EDL44375.1 hypothetical protein, conserved [Plasmodium vivax]|eukprot:XP_001614102.1 hypothetical protein [Plasmodium vivax Sal-1]